MPVKTAILVGIFKAISNIINSVLFCCVGTSAAKAYAGDLNVVPPIMILGTAAYVVGMTVETLSEVQRKRFKSDEKNKGKVFTGGLFSLARHANYGGYTIWKSGYGLVSAGWFWGGLTLVWLSLEFARRGIPALDVYCSKRVSLFC